MHLKELNIFGFKSFADKTNLSFEPGITVVVGPNGCGKSNVFDAIKWALGEQSPKSLRGAKMEDVIFNGTENHPALSYCEVTLTFSNEDRYLPIDYQEVSIARRLYRSGESQYFLNKNVVRLKDIEELFMGTGIGESTYSFVEQGKIEIFLSYKPEDKRLIFDEASGIVKFKDRKKETLKRLQETDDNLLRLEDILAEVNRQVRYLERQVEKARKYKELQETLVTVEKQIACLQLKNIDAQAQTFAQDIDGLVSREGSQAQELAAAMEGLSQLEEKLNQLRVTLDEFNAREIASNAQIENSLSQSAMLKRNIDELIGRGNNLAQTEGALKERLTLHETRFAQEMARCQAIAQELQVADAEIVSLKDEADRLLHAVEEQRRVVSDEKAKIFEFENERSHAHNQLIEIQTNFTALEKRKQRLLLDRAQIDQMLSQRQESLKSIEEIIVILDKELNDLRAAKDALAAKTAELAVQKEDLKTQLNNKEKELVELQSYFEFLQDFKEKYDIFPATKNITVTFNEDPGKVNKVIASLKDVVFTNNNGQYQAQVEAKIISLDESQIQERIDAARGQVAQLKEQIAANDREAARVVAETSGVSAQLSQKEEKYRRVMQDKETLLNDLKRLSEEMTLLEQEMHSTAESMQALDSGRIAKEEEVKRHDESLRLTHEALKHSQNIINKNQERHKEIDIEVARKEAHKLSLHKENDTLHSKMGLFEEEKQNIFITLADIAKEQEGNSVRCESLRGEAVALEAKAAQARQAIEELKAQRVEFDNQEQEILRAMETGKNHAHVLEGEIQKVKDTAYNKKLEAQSLDYEKQKVFDYLRQVYTLELDINESLTVESSLEELQAEKEKLFNRRKSLGEVNLVAIEEFEELKTRKEFMEKQKLDLVTAKEELKKAIGKINKTCRDMFIDTFSKVQEEFKANFKYLFNGGRANLVLLDPENVLESGVEIEVQPPGKKLQNISLLSGGEKSLTAIALIFAIFRVKPSPLCVLDEIDAPLDEANVDRFNSILKEFSSVSQFVVITHNKKTMSHGDVLYGVTMQEKGVSKLVSVKLNNREKPAPAPVDTMPAVSNQDRPEEESAEPAVV